MEDFIKINFTRTTPDGILYSDCLFLPQNHSYSEEEIESLKDEKYQEWYSFVSTPRQDPVIEDSSNTEENIEVVEPSSEQTP